jgi:two-component system phosphate regulon response regulator PhoB
MTSSGHHILVVEDNPALSRVVQLVLGKAGYRVSAACNGQEAWDFVQQNPVDLVVTDQQMPVMAGVELCRKLRNDERFAGLPVVLLTAKGLELDMPALRDELNISGAFAKPFSPAALAEFVGDCLAART